MPLWPVIIGAAVLLIVWTVIPGVKHWQYRRSIREQPSAEADWAKEFPGKLPTVEKVLAIFCNAFLFDKRHLFQFRPSDKLIDVYKGTTGPVADELQMFELPTGLEKSFGVDMRANFDENMTARDVVALAIGAAS
jgi:hypothetical protein